MTVARNTDQALPFLSLFLAYHKDPLHCPQKCLTPLCWVSVYQETNNPAIGGLAQTLIQQNSRDLFSLPAFTHHLQTTMKLPQKQKKLNAFMSNPCLLLKLWNRIIFFFLYSAAKCLGNFVTEAITCKWNYVFTFLLWIILYEKMFRHSYLSHWDSQEWYFIEVNSFAIRKENILDPPFDS